MRDKCLICFLILLSVVFVGWIGGWTRTLKTGNAAYTAGDYHAAQIAFREATLQKPESPLAHYNLGTALYRSGRFNEAIEAFRESVSKHSEKSEATLSLASIYYNLGNAQFKMDDLKSAIDAYKHSLRLAPDDADAQHNLALALQLLQQQRDLAQQRKNKNTEQQTEPDDIGEAEAAQLLEHLSKNENTRRQKLLHQQRKSGYRRSKDW